MKHIVELRNYVLKNEKRWLAKKDIGCQMPSQMRYHQANGLHSMLHSVGYPLQQLAYTNAMLKEEGICPMYKLLQRYQQHLNEKKVLSCSSLDKLYNNTAPECLCYNQSSVSQSVCDIPMSDSYEVNLESITPVHPIPDVLVQNLLMSSNVACRCGASCCSVCGPLRPPSKYRNEDSYQVPLPPFHPGSRYSPSHHPHSYDTGSLTTNNFNTNFSKSTNDASAYNYEVKYEYVNDENNPAICNAPPKLFAPTAEHKLKTFEQQTNTGNYSVTIVDPNAAKQFEYVWKGFPNTPNPEGQSKNPYYSVNTETLPVRKKKKSKKKKSKIQQIQQQLGTYQTTTYVTNPFTIQEHENPIETRVNQKKRRLNDPTSKLRYVYRPANPFKEKAWKINPKDPGANLTINPLGPDCNQTINSLDPDANQTISENVNMQKPRYVYKPVNSFKNRDVHSDSLDFDADETTSDNVTTETPENNSSNKQQRYLPYTAPLNSDRRIQPVKTSDPITEKEINIHAASVSSDTPEQETPKGKNSLFTSILDKSHEKSKKIDIEETKERFSNLVPNTLQRGYIFKDKSILKYKDTDMEMSDLSQNIHIKNRISIEGKHDRKTSLQTSHITPITVNNINVLSKREDEDTKNMYEVTTSSQRRDLKRNQENVLDQAITASNICYKYMKVAPPVRKTTSQKLTPQQLTPVTACSDQDTHKWTISNDNKNEEMEQQSRLQYVTPPELKARYKQTYKKIAQAKGQYTNSNQQHGLQFTAATISDGKNTSEVLTSNLSDPKVKHILKHSAPATPHLNRMSKKITQYDLKSSGKDTESTKNCGTVFPALKNKREEKHIAATRLRVDLNSDELSPSSNQDFVQNLTGVRNSLIPQRKTEAEIENLDRNLRNYSREVDENLALEQTVIREDNLVGPLAQSKSEVKAKNLDRNLSMHSQEFDDNLAPVQIVDRNDSISGSLFKSKTETEAENNNRYLSKFSREIYENTTPEQTLDRKENFAGSLAQRKTETKAEYLDSNLLKYLPKHASEETVDRHENLTPDQTLDRIKSLSPRRIIDANKIVAPKRIVDRIRTPAPRKTADRLYINKAKPRQIKKNEQVVTTATAKPQNLYKAVTSPDRENLKPDKKFTQPNVFEDGDTNEANPLFEVEQNPNECNTATVVNYTSGLVPTEIRKHNLDEPLICTPIRPDMVNYSQHICSPLRPMSKYSFNKPKEMLSAIPRLRRNLSRTGTEKQNLHKVTHKSKIPIMINSNQINPLVRGPPPDKNKSLHQQLLQVQQNQELEDSQKEIDDTEELEEEDLDQPTQNSINKISENSVDDVSETLGIKTGERERASAQFSDEYEEDVEASEPNASSQSYSPKPFAALVNKTDIETGKKTKFADDAKTSVYKSGIFDKTNNQFIVSPVPNKTINMNPLLVDQFQFATKHNNETVLEETETMHKPDFLIKRTDSGIKKNYISVHQARNINVVKRQPKGTSSKSQYEGCTCESSEIISSNVLKMDDSEFKQENSNNDSFVKNYSAQSKNEYSPSVQILYSESNVSCDTITPDNNSLTSNLEYRPTEVLKCDYFSYPCMSKLECPEPDKSDCNTQNSLIFYTGESLNTQQRLKRSENIYEMSGPTPEVLEEEVVSQSKCLNESMKLQPVSEKTVPPGTIVENQPAKTNTFNSDESRTLQTEERHMIIREIFIPNIELFSEIAQKTTEIIDSSLPSKNASITETVQELRQINPMVTNSEVHFRNSNSVEQNIETSQNLSKRQSDNNMINKRTYSTSAFVIRESLPKTRLESAPPMQVLEDIAQLKSTPPLVKTTTDDTWVLPQNTKQVTTPSSKISPLHISTSPTAVKKFGKLLSKQQRHQKRLHRISPFNVNHKDLDKRSEKSKNYFKKIRETVGGIYGAQKTIPKFETKKEIPPELKKEVKEARRLATYIRQLCAQMNLCKGGSANEGSIPPNPCCSSDTPKYQNVIKVMASISLICLMGAIYRMMRLENEQYIEPPCADYEYLNRRTKKIPWGDGNIVLFPNDKTNNVPGDSTPEKNNGTSEVTPCENPTDETVLTLLPTKEYEDYEDRLSDAEKLFEDEELISKLPKKIKIKVTSKNNGEEDIIPLLNYNEFPEDNFKEATAFEENHDSPKKETSKLCVDNPLNVSLEVDQEN